jgi:hypothetical protein
VLGVNPLSFVPFYFFVSSFWRLTDYQFGDTKSRKKIILIHKQCWCLFIYAAFKAYCANWVRRSNFRHQASPRVSPSESTQRRKVELWARNVRELCLNIDFHVTFWDLLHAVKLRHGIDGFTSPPKEGVLRIFSP